MNARRFATTLVWVARDDERLREAAILRYEVLMAPFGVPPIDDWDDADAASSHLIAQEDDRVVGYARLIDLGHEGQLRQLAVALDRQRMGIGTRLVEEVLAEASRRGLERLFLHARLAAVPFYERLGFRTVSEEPFPFGRTGQLHVRMECETR